MKRQAASSRKFVPGVVVVLIVVASVLLWHGFPAVADEHMCNTPLKLVDGPVVDSSWHGVASRSGAQALSFGGSLVNIPGLENLFVQFYQATCQADGTSGSEQFFQRDVMSSRGIKGTLTVLDCLKSQFFYGFISGNRRVDVGVECFSAPPKIFGSVREGSMTLDTHFFATYVNGVPVTIQAKGATGPSRLEYEVSHQGQTFTHSVPLSSDITSLKALVGTATTASSGQQPRNLAVIDTSAFATCP